MAAKKSKMAAKKSKMATINIVFAIGPSALNKCDPCIFKYKEMPNTGITEPPRGEIAEADLGR